MSNTRYLEVRLAVVIESSWFSEGHTAEETNSSLTISRTTEGRFGVEVRNENPTRVGQLVIPLKSFSQLCSTN